MGVTSRLAVTLLRAKRLVSWNCDPVRSEEDRCEIREAAAYGFEPGAVCSLIRALPLVGSELEQLLERPSRPTQGQVRPGQLASYKQEFSTTRSTKLSMSESISQKPIWTWPGSESPGAWPMIQPDEM